MPPTCLSPTTVPSSTVTWTRNITKNPTGRPPIKPKLVSFTTCKASSSYTSSITDFDLYDLLGVQRSSDQSQIKAAYRALQKRCHPDIAGPAGHDMAIFLNEAYSLLSDPASRHAYDKEQAKLADLNGYTGKPIYSVWCGSETEHRAVFVDEVKCVGCLKCALIADKTFAIETTFGRARVVAQWADPESKIQEAIDACPIDCISVVERSDLASLEFLMSKQPRGKVRIGASNSVGARVSNVFVEVKKFQARYEEAMGRTSRQSSQEMDLQRDARINTVEAIRSIARWLNWYPSDSTTPNSSSKLKIILRTQKDIDPDIQKLKEAAAARERARKSGIINRKAASWDRDEYWIPSTPALPSSGDNSLRASSFPKPLPVNRRSNSLQDDYRTKEKRRKEPILQKIPFGIATLAVFMVQHQTNSGVSEIKQHIGGSLALSIVNSPWLPTFLTWFIWYFVAAIAVELMKLPRTSKKI